MIEAYANTLAAVVVITSLGTLIAITWYETRESKKRVDYYRAREWEDDEGGAP